MLTAVSTVPSTFADEFRRCFEEHRFADLAQLYHPEATLEVYVGQSVDRRRGIEGIIERYAADYAAGATFLRWAPRVAPWGAVIEAEAIQTDGATQLRFRWVHVLTIDEARITGDTVYCTGGVPT